MNKAIFFIFGAATGSLVTWAIIRERYKRIADEEIESVVQRFKDREKQEELMHSAGLSIVEPCSKNTGVTTTASYTIDSEEYEKIVNELGYTNDEMDELLNDPSTSVEKTDDGCEIFVGVDKERIEPYTISPVEYGESYDYDTKSWTYYADFVLTDEVGEIVNNPEDIIGDALLHFGEYEEDSVYVRNENIECDYEILKHEKTFSEINGSEMND